MATTTIDMLDMTAPERSNRRNKPLRPRDKHILKHRKVSFLRILLALSSVYTVNAEHQPRTAAEASSPPQTS
jgi:hypothetical protein